MCGILQHLVVKFDAAALYPLMMWGYRQAFSSEKKKVKKTKQNVGKQKNVYKAY